MLKCGNRDDDIIPDPRSEFSDVDIYRIVSTFIFVNYVIGTYTHFVRDIKIMGEYVPNFKDFYFFSSFYQIMILSIDIW